MALAFGIAAHAPPRSTKAAFRALLDRLSKHCGLDLEPFYAGSYEELTARFADGHATLAWLPPLPFIALERANVAVPLVSHRRGHRSGYEAVLIVHKDSPYYSAAELANARVAWVDPLSTAGYVVPRIGLAAMGIDPRTTFGSERFFGSHEAAARAVVGRAVDVAATYAQQNRPSGRVVGPWTSIRGAADAVRVLVTFGEIPSDVTAARRALPKKTRKEIAAALLALGNDSEGARMLHDVFGIDAMHAWEDQSYEAMRQAVADAGARGLLGAIETLDVTRL
jgi:phosphate/phosphite/phosphonate ABC transporter binding protein